jgi:hypothetical protein
VTVTDLFAGTSTSCDCQGGGAGAYAAAREGTGTKNTNATVPLYSGFDRLSDTDQFFGQIFLQFPTNLLGDVEEVTNAVLTLFGHSAQTPQAQDTFRFRAYDFGAGVNTSDYRAGSALAALTLLASFAMTGWTTSGANAFTPEAGMNAWVNRTSVSRGVVHTSIQESATDPGGSPQPIGPTCYSLAEAGTTLDPVLTVTQGVVAAQTPYRQDRQLVAFRGY